MMLVRVLPDHRHDQACGLSAYTIRTRWTGKDSSGPLAPCLPSSKNPARLVIAVGYYSALAHLLGAQAQGLHDRPPAREGQRVTSLLQRLPDAIGGVGFRGTCCHMCTRRCWYPSLLLMGLAGLGLPGLPCSSRAHTAETRCFRPDSSQQSRRCLWLPEGDSKHYQPP